MRRANPPARSNAIARRADVVARAVSVFAQTGYHATRVSTVAEASGISEAYVFRLFGGKLGLFLAALDDCYGQVEAAMSAGADRARSAAPDDVLGAMAEAYADLIEDRDLIALQVHAQSAASVPEIGAAVRRGCERVVTLVQARSGADAPAVQRFMAYGQLCHLIVIADLATIPAQWARLLRAGMRHPGKPRPTRSRAGRRRKAR